MTCVFSFFFALCASQRPPDGYTSTFRPNREVGLPADPPTHPPELPLQGAVSTGRWRNMFVEMGISEAVVAQRVDAIFEQLFFGDADEQRLMYDASDGSGAYILSVDSNDVRSEGMSCSDEARTRAARLVHC